jgi:hypothetical protein
MKNAINATSTDLAVNAKYKMYILNYFSHIVWDSRGCDWMVARITYILYLAFTARSVLVAFIAFFIKWERLII